MSWFTLAFLLALVGSSAYAAGRMHLRFAYRAGYRHGHTDGAHRQVGTMVRVMEEVSRNGSAVYARRPAAGPAGLPSTQEYTATARHRRMD
ncbi:hypothetical protein O7623_16430 [Solwaraspora sp. WMMD791]|uniref:hypothetical protein n=1 Tax=Solwaraspora sp. WMMD791 TaxID=3016086 RepID=UPI00249B1703|nr:hypothetical protein [Solwaraspora sp. WMMD791]WFE25010.1 hypothetical protein O7623_16430 [Solwaraspora sp. WMMD791]